MAKQNVIWAVWWDQWSVARAKVTYLLYALDIVYWTSLNIFEHLGTSLNIFWLLSHLISIPAFGFVFWVCCLGVSLCVFVADWQRGNNSLFKLHRNVSTSTAVSKFRVLKFADEWWRFILLIRLFDLVATTHSCLTLFRTGFGWYARRTGGGGGGGGVKITPHLNCQTKRARELIFCMEVPTATYFPKI